MKRQLIVLALAVILFMPSVAQAGQVVEWTADPPKQGTAGFVLCTGQATAEGVTYINHNWVDYDPKSPGYQKNYCADKAVVDVQNFFRYNSVSISPVLTQSVDLPASAVKVSSKQY